MASLCTLLAKRGLNFAHRQALAGVMRILLLTETLCAGGAETFVVRLANALAGRGDDVMIAVMNGEMVHPAVADKIEPSVTVDLAFQPIKRSVQRADRILRALRIDLAVLQNAQRRWLRQVIHRWRPDVVHSHLVKADWLAASLKAESATFRHVITIHGEQLAYSRGTANPQMLHYERRLQTILDQADGIALISDEQEGHFRDLYEVPAGSIARIYNGYEAPDLRVAGPSRADLGLPLDHLIFGMVSRGIADKGWGEAIEAFQRIGREETVLVLVGEGPFFVQLGDPPPGVILAGFSGHPIDWIRHFDVGLLPSYYIGESLPTVVVEYLICGVPVIASDIGEIPAMMRRTASGELAGILVPHRDREKLVKELADAMTRLADDSALRRRMSARANEAAEVFNMEHCIEQYGRLYRSRNANDAEVAA